MAALCGGCAGALTGRQLNCTATGHAKAARGGRMRMTEFEFVFPLFALLVGLSITEMLSGLAHALKSKRDIHVGWLAPLLGTLILANLAMFWQGSWEIRHEITASSGSLLLVLMVGGAYFLAASMVFPSWGAEVRDLDEHFMDVAAGSLAFHRSLQPGLFHPGRDGDQRAAEPVVVGRQRAVPGALADRGLGSGPVDDPGFALGTDRRARGPAGCRLTCVPH